MVATSVFYPKKPSRLTCSRKNGELLDCGSGRSAGECPEARGRKWRTRKQRIIAESPWHWFHHGAAWSERVHRPPRCARTKTAPPTSLRMTSIGSPLS